MGSGAFPLKSRELCGPIVNLGLSYLRNLLFQQILKRPEKNSIYHDSKASCLATAFILSSGVIARNALGPEKFQNFRETLYRSSREIWDYSIVLTYSSCEQWGGFPNLSPSCSKL